MKLNIKNRVDNLGISKNKLAQQLGISYPTMLDMYNGESTSVKLDILEKLCHILQCTPNDILAYDNPKTEPSQSKKSIVLHLSDLHFPSSEKDASKAQLQHLLDTLKVEISDGTDGRKRGYIFLDAFDEITPAVLEKLQSNKLQSPYQKDTNNKDDTE